MNTKLLINSLIPGFYLDVRARTSRCAFALNPKMGDGWSPVGMWLVSVHEAPTYKAGKSNIKCERHLGLAHNSHPSFCFIKPSKTTCLSTSTSLGGGTNLIL